MIVLKSSLVAFFAPVLLIVALFAFTVPFPSGVVLSSPDTVSTTVIDADCPGAGKKVNVTLCVDPTIPLLISKILASTLISVTATPL